MMKSSRFWWLHGVILAAAVVGCKSNSCCTGNNSYGPTGQGVPPPAGVAGPTAGVGSSMYHQGATGGYPMSGMTSPSSMGGAGMPGGAAGMAGGQSFAPQGGAMYGGPGLSSGLGAH